MRFKNSLRALMQRRRMGMVRVAVATVFAVAVVHSSQSLATEEDTQAWLAAFATKSIDDRWIAYMEVQTRFSDDTSRLSQTLLRPAVGYRLSSNISVWAGYGPIESEGVITTAIINKNQLVADAPCQGRAYLASKRNNIL